MVVVYESQGCINGKVSQLVGNSEQLKSYMADKTDEQKRQARIHLRTVKLLRGKSK